jgi:hypothetical protein
MPQASIMPKISGTINNCGFNAAIPSVLKVFAQMDDPSFDKTYKQEYEKLKKMFCEFYGLDNANTTFTQLHQFISTISSEAGKKTRSFYEQELILGPVLRKYFIENFKEKNDEFNFEATPKYKEVLLEKSIDEEKADAQSVGAYVADDEDSPDLGADGRYTSVGPTHLHWHLYSKLGISFELKAKDASVEEIVAEIIKFNAAEKTVDNPVDAIDLFFSGDHYELELENFSQSAHAENGIAAALQQAVSSESKKTTVEKILGEFKQETSREFTAFQEQSLQQPQNVSSGADGKVLSEASLGRIKMSKGENENTGGVLISVTGEGERSLSADKEKQLDTLKEANLTKSAQSAVVSGENEEPPPMQYSDVNVQEFQQHIQKYFTGTESEEQRYINFHTNVVQAIKEKRQLLPQKLQEDIEAVELTHYHEDNINRGDIDFLDSLRLPIKSEKVSEEKLAEINQRLVMLKEDRQEELFKKQNLDFQQALAAYNTFVTNLPPSCSVETLHSTPEWKKYSTSKETLLRTGDLLSKLSDTRGFIEAQEQKAYEEQLSTSQQKLQERITGLEFTALSAQLKEAPDPASAQVVIDTEANILKKRHHSRIDLLKHCFESAKVTKHIMNDAQISDLVQRRLKDSIPPQQQIPTRGFTSLFSATEPKPIDPVITNYLKTLDPNFIETKQGKAASAKSAFTRKNYPQDSKESTFVAERVQKNTDTKELISAKMGNLNSQIQSFPRSSYSEQKESDLLEMRRNLHEINYLNITLPQHERFDDQISEFTRKVEECKIPKDTFAEVTENVVVVQPAQVVDSSKAGAGVGDAAAVNPSSTNPQELGQGQAPLPSVRVEGAAKSETSSNIRGTEVNTRQQVRSPDNSTGGRADVQKSRAGATTEKIIEVSSSGRSIENRLDEISSRSQSLPASLPSDDLQNPIVTDQEAKNEQLRGAIKAYADADKTSIQSEKKAYEDFSRVVGTIHIQSLDLNDDILLKNVDRDHHIFLMVCELNKKSFTSQRDLDNSVAAYEEAIDGLVDLWYPGQSKEPIKQSYRQQLHDQLQPLYQKKQVEILKKEIQDLIDRVPLNPTPIDLDEYCHERDLLLSRAQLNPVFQNPDPTTFTKVSEKTLIERAIETSEDKIAKLFIEFQKNSAEAKTEIELKRLQEDYCKQELVHLRSRDSKLQRLTEKNIGQDQAKVTTEMLAKDSARNIEYASITQKEAERINSLKPETRGGFRKKTFPTSQFLKEYNKHIESQNPRVQLDLSSAKSAFSNLFDVEIDQFVARVKLRQQQLEKAQLEYSQSLETVANFAKQPPVRGTTKDQLQQISQLQQELSEVEEKNALAGAILGVKVNDANQQIFIASSGQIKNALDLKITELRQTESDLLKAVDAAAKTLDSSRTRENILKFRDAKRDYTVETGRSLDPKFESEELNLAVQKEEQSEKIDVILIALRQIDKESQDPPTRSFLEELTRLEGNLSEEQSQEFERLKTIFKIRSLTVVNFPNLTPDNQDALKVFIIDEIRKSQSYQKGVLEALVAEYATPLIQSHLKQSHLVNQESQAGATTETIIEVSSTGIRIEHSLDEHSSRAQPLPASFLASENSSDTPTLYPVGSLRRTRSLDDSKRFGVEGNTSSIFSSSARTRSSSPVGGDFGGAGVDGFGGGTTTPSTRASSQRPTDYNGIVAAAIENYWSTSNSDPVSIKYQQFVDSIKIVKEHWGEVNEDLRVQVCYTDANFVMNELSSGIERDIMSCNNPTDLNSLFQSIKGNLQQIVHSELSKCFPEDFIGTKEDFTRVQAHYVSNLTTLIESTKAQRAADLAPLRSRAQASAEGGGGVGVGGDPQLAQSTPLYREKLAEGRKINTQHINVDGDTYYLATDDAQYAQATLCWSGVKGCDTLQTAVELQTDAVQQRICNDIMHMIGNVLSKGGPAYISSQDQFVLKFADHYLEHLRKQDGTITYTLPPGAPKAEQADKVKFDRFIQEYNHASKHQNDVQTWKQTRIEALKPKEVRVPTSLRIGGGGGGG